MAIIQISKIQQRSGNIVDLPQLDEAEFGWASDVKKLYIGKTTPNENIEVLTSYSNISFSQINGSYGNLNIDSANLYNGQVLTYTGTEWTNRGGNIGGLVDLGDVSNVKIEGGAISYVLETDGTGNLSWAPKSTIVAFIENVTQESIANVTTTSNNYFVNGSAVTVTNVSGMTELNGNTYYTKVISANTFQLYTDSGLSIGLNTTGYGQFPYTNVSATSASTNRITVADSSLFAVDDPVVFVGTTFGGIVAGTTYYILSTPTGTTITISETKGGTTFPLLDGSGVDCNVYVSGGRLVSLVSGGGGVGTGIAGGSNTSIQFNNVNVLDGSSDLTFNFGITPKVLTLNGNANVGNLNATGSIFGSTLTSNVSTGTPPITVSSTTRVSNLNVSYSNVADFVNITTSTSGTQYVMLANALTGNVSESANANLTFNSATGNLGVTLLNVSSNANIGNIGVSGQIIATGNVTGANFIGNFAGLYANGNSNVTITANSNITMYVAGNTTARFTATSTGAVANGTMSVSGNLSGANISTSGGNGRLTSNVLVLTGAATGNANNSTVTAGIGLKIISSTYTDNSAAAGTTIANTAIHAVGTPTLAAANSTVVATNASTLFIQSAPTAGTNMTITNGYALYVASGAIRTTNLTTDANTTAGTITGNWSLTAGSRLNATYADLAEYYVADQNYEPGTVLEFGGTNEVTIATDGTNKVAGVVSSNPAYVMNSECLGEYRVAIALQGRAPTKVTGMIKKGDMLVSAGNGLAKSSNNPMMGTVIGKSLEDFEGSSGIIEIAIGRL